MERSLRGKPRSDGDNLGRRSLHHLDLESREMAAREPLLIPFIWSRESSSGRMREIGVISVLFPLGKELASGTFLLVALGRFRYLEWSSSSSASNQDARDRLVLKLNKIGMIAAP